MEAQVNKERKMVEKGIFILMNYFLQVKGEKIYLYAKRAINT
jgi:hypothetical protein